MNQPILAQAITRQQVDGIEQTAVDARQLHAFLENGDLFANWIKDRIHQYGFLEGADFLILENTEIKKGRGGDRRSREYVLSVDMAKELCMVERNAKGKEARLYFIEMERQAKTLSHVVPQSLPEALRLAATLAERVEKQESAIKALEPKAKFHDQVSDSIESVSVADFAKALGTGEIRFFKWLREMKFLFKEGRHNKPYQQFIDRGYFKLVEKTYDDENGESHSYFRVLITGKGQIYLAEKWSESQAA